MVGLLDQLVERKDIDSWTKRREADLRAAMQQVVEDAKPQDRGHALQKLRGRISEVRNVRRLLNEQRFREEAKGIQARLVERGLWPPENTDDQEGAPCLQCGEPMERDFRNTFCVLCDPDQEADDV